VVFCEVLPDAAAMQALASKVGYSETAFAALADGEWRVRYFAPEVEVDFCGHATIALGAALALRNGDGIFPLRLNHARITVEGSRPRRFHARNPFPIGGVFEDPATGLLLRPSPDTCAISAGRMAERSRSFRAKTWVCHLAFGSR
jgi:predicted PhzF superfamily epimerase YddE/YHI9